MKDIERIQSTELAAQVQDANPANFAIEQEVAQLVGATVPAPTQPSADDARELPAQLLVFLRRALLPIRSALRTAVAAIYAHLDSRCTAYTPAGYDPFRLPAGPYDPMRPFVPRTLPNLLTALTAFDGRKISNGSATSDGIPDGVSLAHLFGSSDASASVTEITDDNTGWTWNKALPVFPNAETMHLACKHILIPSSGFFVNGWNSLEEATIDAEDLYFDPNHYGNQIGVFNNCSNLKKVTLKLKEIHPTTSASWNNMQICLLQNCAAVEEIDAKDWSVFECNLTLGCPNIKKIVFGKITQHWVQWGDPFDSKADLIHLEFGAGVTISLNLQYWSPTNALDASRTDLIKQGSEAENNLQQFLQNFKEHIAIRLTANGSGKTLTLSQAVFDTIWNADGTPKSTDPDSVIYQINKIIKTDKHWSVNRA